MPTRSALLMAVPQCPGYITNLTYGHKKENPCGLPMTWLHEDGQWKCRKHGKVKVHNALLSTQNEEVISE